MRTLLVGVVAALVAASGAAGGTKLIVGVTEDGLKYEPGPTRRDAQALGIDAVRITLTWRPGRLRPTAEQRADLDRATSGARDLRIVLSVFGERAVFAPTTERRRDEFCEFVRWTLARYRVIRDVVVWNEPNKEFFWRPQFDRRGRSAAPRAYAALLARCWDVVHAERDDVNVLAPSTAARGNDEPNAASNVSHSPVLFFEELARAYRASGRTRPLFDTVAHHVHVTEPSERPWRRHRGTRISQGDWGRLVATLRRAFRGTPQPVPGRCVAGRCAAIWYLEAGFQTRPDPAKARFYTGTADAGVPDAAAPVRLAPLPTEVSPAPDQASQLVAALRLAYCQPYVEGFFNFLLWDEARLEGWQSGVYWADRTPKGSFGAVRDAIRDVKAGRVSCRALRRELPDPAATVGNPGPATAETQTTTAAESGTTTTAESRPPEPTATAPVTSPEAAADEDGDNGAVAAAATAVLIAIAVAGALAWRRSRSRRISR